VSWVPYRQDGAGPSYEAEVRRITEVWAGGLFREPGRRRARETPPSSHSTSRGESQRAKEPRAALSELQDLTQRYLPESSAQAGPPGGANPLRRGAGRRSCTRLAYPLHPGQSGFLRSDPDSRINEVARPTNLGSAAGELPSRQIRLDSNRWAHRSGEFSGQPIRVAQAFASMSRGFARIGTGTSSGRRSGLDWKRWGLFAGPLEVVTAGNTVEGFGKNTSKRDAGRPTHRRFSDTVVAGAYVMAA